MKKTYSLFIILFLFMFKLNQCREKQNNIKSFAGTIEYSEDSKKSFQMLEEGYAETILNIEMDRKEYKIVYSANKFINENSELTYIVESYSNNLIIQNKNSKGLKNINIIEYNDYLTVNKTGNTEEVIKITSIPNSNLYIELLFDNNYDELFLKQKFTNIKIIETKEDKLIAVFGSFDENHEVYYTKYSKDTMSPKDIYPINLNKFTPINIKDEIVNLDKESIYIIINNVSDHYLSSLELFITQKDNKKEEIILINDTEKYLYLNKDKTYTINLNSIKNSRLIKLSSKTINSKISINNDIKLDKENKYYELNKNANIQLKIDNEDALIEFLYYFGIEKVFNEVKIDHQKIEEVSSTLHILIKHYPLDDYIIKLESDIDKSFGTSIYAKFGRGNYHYYSIECDQSLTFGFSFEETIKIDKSENIKVENDEYYMIYLSILKNKDQPIYLSYYPKNYNTFNKTELNGAKFSNFELDLQQAYEYIIKNDDTYSFEISIKDKDKKKSYYPIYILDNKTIINELKLDLKNEGDNKNTSVYINFYKNWTKEYEVSLIVMAGKAKSILTAIYVISGIIIAASAFFCVWEILKIIKTKNEDSLVNDTEMLTA